VCHIFLFVNHKPKVKDDSFGFWRGVRLWPFLRRFEGTADDKDLAKKLEVEKPGILNWFIAGCLKWQKCGISELPEKITTATAEYKRESNILTDFFDECYIENPNAMTQSSEIYKDYLSWADNNHLQKYEIMSSVIFSREVEKKYKKVAKNNGKFFVGIGKVTGFVTGFSLDDKNSNVFPSSVTYTRENIEKPSQPVTPSLFTKNSTPKKLTTMGNCPDCGSDNIGVWPDGTPGYYCLDCYPNFSDEPNF
jgi:phage/plasmid-associated DNA primase